MKTLAERARAVKRKVFFVGCFSTAVGAVAFVLDRPFIGGICWALAVVNIVSFTRLQYIIKRSQ